MLIDCHMHFFPDKIAKMTITRLKDVSTGMPNTDGTLSGTLDFMRQEKIDLGISLSIATKPSQQRTINDYAASTQKQYSDKLLCFGSVHPYAPDVIEELQRIQKLGLYGVKLHADYQGYYFDDVRCYPMYKEIAALGLPLTIHAGYDPYSPEIQHASSQAIARVANDIPSLTLIAAHMGGLRSIKEARTCLAGMTNVYFDTAMSDYIFEDPAEFEEIIRLHGVDRILFGTDCPWSTATRGLKLLERTKLTEQEKELICNKNAWKLFGLS